MEHPHNYKLSHLLRINAFEEDDSLMEYVPTFHLFNRLWADLRVSDFYS